MKIEKLEREQLVELMVARGFEEQHARTIAIFTPMHTARIAQSLREQRRFVHYTSADTAMKIAETGYIWLRNVRLMNDWSEVWHGMAFIWSATFFQVIAENHSWTNWIKLNPV